VAVPATDTPQNALTPNYGTVIASACS